MTKTGLEFRILVIVICLIFVICDLEFLLLQYSSIPLVIGTRPRFVSGRSEDWPSLDGEYLDDHLGWEQVCPPKVIAPVPLFQGLTPAN